MLRIMLVILAAVMTVISFPVLLLGKITILVGDTICYCVCMWMAKLHDTLKWPETALSWLRIYRGD